MFLIILAVLIAAIWFYLMAVRPVLRARFPGAWETIDMVEGWLFRNSRQFIVSRLTLLGGAVVMVHDSLANAGFDWTPLLTQISQRVPTEYQFMVVPLCLAGFGLLLEFIKRTHETQASDKEA